MKQFKTINQNKADIEIGYKEQKQHLIDIMKSDEDLGLYEEPKQETLEEAAYQARRDYQDEVGKDGMNDCIMFDAMKIQKGFKQGAKWQQERMYSEEEVMDILLLSYSSISDKSLAGADLRKWFEQFKKK